MDRTSSPPGTNRRVFFLGLGTVALASLLKLVPVVSGLVVFLQPLRRRPTDGAFLPVATLEGLPADGSPRRFPVIADRVNAWTRTPRVAIGAVYLRRTPEGAVHAFNVTCPHAGCFVHYQAGSRSFQCPCHQSHFGLDGSISNPRSPSPRGLDELEVQVQPSGQILVRYQNFRPGVADKIPVA